MNGLQDGTPYDGLTVGNSLHSLCFHCVLSRFVLDGGGTSKEESSMRSSFSTPKEIARGLNHIWESKIGTHFSERIIEDVDLALKSLEIFHRTNEAPVGGVADRNGHIRKGVGEGKIVSWVGAWTKGRGASANSPKRCSCTVIR